ncbi:MAG: CPBP family intramembrane metalloprotease [Phycisphaerae bacterium]|nr:CPBP family intramembrane metalloprotease [Phycisphaerae bacterium]
MHDFKAGADAVAAVITRQAGEMRRGLAVQITGAAIAYVAVVLGYYVFNSTPVTLGIYHGGIVAYVVLTGQTTVVRQLVHGWRTRLGLAATAVFAATGIAVWYVWPLAALPEVDFAARLAERGIGGPAFWWFAAAIIFVNPALEEILWRGCLVDNARRPSWIDAAFAGFHLLGMLLMAAVWVSLLTFLLLAAVSWFLRYVRAATGGLAICWVAHTAADISIVTAMYLLLQ